MIWDKLNDSIIVDMVGEQERSDVIFDLSDSDNPQAVLVVEVVDHPYLSKLLLKMDQKQFRNLKSLLAEINWPAESSETA